MTMISLETRPCPRTLNKTMLLLEIEDEAANLGDPVEIQRILEYIVVRRDT